jgi:hypothetical protein
MLDNGSFSLLPRCSGPRFFQRPRRLSQSPRWLMMGNASSSSLLDAYTSPPPSLSISLSPSLPPSAYLDYSRTALLRLASVLGEAGVSTGAKQQNHTSSSSQAKLSLSLSLTHTHTHPLSHKNTQTQTFIIYVPPSLPPSLPKTLNPKHKLV